MNKYGGHWDFFTFTKKILNGKPHFLCSVECTFYKTITLSRARNQNDDTIYRSLLNLINQKILEKTFVNPEITVRK